MFYIGNDKAVFELFGSCAAFLRVKLCANLHICNKHVLFVHCQSPWIHLQWSMGMRINIIKVRYYREVIVMYIGLSSSTHNEGGRV